MKENYLNLSLARGQINDSGYQDASKFIKASQKIQPSKTANQLMIKVNDKVAEEALYLQQQLQQQQVQPTPKQKEEPGFGDMFR